MYIKIWVVILCIAKEAKAYLFTLKDISFWQARYELIKYMYIKVWVVILFIVKEAKAYLFTCKPSITDLFFENS